MRVEGCVVEGGAGMLCQVPYCVWACICVCMGVCGGQRPGLGVQRGTVCFLSYPLHQADTYPAVPVAVCPLDSLSTKRLTKGVWMIKVLLWSAPLISW